MTDDELDLLASAYVDGEATSEEVALVERDPALQARVEQFRSLGGGLAQTPAPPAALKQAQLSAALAEFEAVRPGGSPVVDLRDRAAARRQRPQRSLPSWLPAAAVFLLLGGGVIWAANRTGSSTDETASGDFDTAAETAEDAASADDAEASDEGAVDDEARAMAEALEEDTAAGTDDDAGDAAAESVMAGSADGSGAADEAEASEEPSPTTAASAPRVELPPQLFFDEIPVADAIDDLPTPETDLTLSRCGDELLFPGSLEPTGFIPVEVAGQPAELFVAVDVDGTEIRLLVDRLCAPLEP